MLTAWEWCRVVKEKYTPSFPRPDAPKARQKSPDHIEELIASIRRICVWHVEIKYNGYGDPEKMMLMAIAYRQLEDILVDRGASTAFGLKVAYPTRCQLSVDFFKFTTFLAKWLNCRSDGSRLNMNGSRHKVTKEAAIEG